MYYILIIPYLIIRYISQYITILFLLKRNKGNSESLQRLIKEERKQEIDFIKRSNYTSLVKLIEIILTSILIYFLIGIAIYLGITL